MKLRTWVGLGTGAAAYCVLAAAAWLTPLRVPVLEWAGRDFAVLRHQAELYRAEQVRHPQDPALAEALRETESRKEAWRRSKEKTTLLGFAGWVVDLWPWLAFLGLALPFAGALVAAQGGAPPGAATPTRGSTAARRPQAPTPAVDAAPEAPVPEPSRSTDPGIPPARQQDADPPVPPVPAVPPAPPVTPDPRPSARPSASPADWDWSARPVARAPRAPRPFVKSDLDNGQEDNGQ